MKKIIGWIILVIVIIFFLWLILALVTWVKGTPSGGTDGRTGAPAVESIDITKAVRDIKGDYKNDPRFQQCVVSSVDSCLSQVISDIQREQETPNIALCDDYISETAGDNCRAAIVMSAALKSGDMDTCNSLSNEVNKVACRTEVVFQKGITQESVAVCDALGDAKPECVNRLAERLAQQTGDAGWCDQIIYTDDDENGRRGIGENDVTRCKDDAQRTVTENLRQETDRADREEDAAARQAESEQQAQSDAQDQATAQEQTDQSTTEPTTAP